MHLLKLRMAASHSCGSDGRRSTRLAGRTTSCEDVSGVRLPEAKPREHLVHHDRPVDQIAQQRATGTERQQVGLRKRGARCQLQTK
jgi:hypothetical protein